MTRQQTSLQRKRFANNHLRLRLFLVELRPRKRAAKKNQHYNESTCDARSTACGVACREGRTEARRSVCETQSGSRVTTTRQRKAKGRPKSACCKYHARNPSLVVAKQPGRSFWCRRSCRAINMTLQQMFCQCDRSAPQLDILERTVTKCAFQSFQCRFFVWKWHFTEQNGLFFYRGCSRRNAENESYIRVPTHFQKLFSILFQ